MFGRLRLSGSEERGIALETRCGNGVANAQVGEPDEHSINIFVTAQVADGHEVLD